jgi:hypothetical protein
MSAMRRIPRAALTVLLVVMTGSCTSGGGGGTEQLEIIDPQGTEFAQHRAAARARMTEVERSVQSAAGGTRVVGVREDVGCVLGNKGPKGQEDVWDSQCDLRRSLGIFATNPVRAMLEIDKVLVKLGYRGTWYARHRSAQLDPAAVRRGTTPQDEVSSAIYANSGGLAVSLQVGRTGERQLFLTTSPRPGYFNQSEGQDWESVVPRGTAITEPLVAVELRIPHFIKRPITA